MNITQLVASAQANPPKPVIEGLLNEAEIAGLHGPSEVFKTIFCIHLAHAIATGTPLLDTWQVPQPRKVFFFETEMSAQSLGTRIAKMYTRRPLPQVEFADDPQLRQFQRAGGLQAKFDLLRGWIVEHGAEVLIIDTANPFFRAGQSANEETAAGEFFDLLSALPVPAKFFVRHNRKPGAQEFLGVDAVDKIRGSGQFADVPDLLLQIRRSDKRTHEASLSVTKFRHGTKPDDLPLWLDAADLSLITVPPVIYLLQNGPKSRVEVIRELKARFNFGHSKGDAHIKDYLSYLRDSRSGHNVVYEIAWDRQEVTGATWYSRLPGVIEVVSEHSVSLSHSPREQDAA